MIERDIYKIKVKYKRSEFEQCLRNVMKDDENRFFSICSAIGDLLHGYKDQAYAKAIIFSMIKYLIIPNVEVGKSLIGNAISKIKSQPELTGKTSK